MTLLALAGLLKPCDAPCAEPPGEFQLKSAALYNIIAFTDWPPAAFATPDSPLVIGVIGEGPAVTLLEQSAFKETWRGRRVTVRRLGSGADARACHVLFIARSDQNRWASIRRQLARLPVLTASDAQNFARDGGMVQFAMERNKLRLIVNLEAARANGILISSKVLRLAEVIEQRPP